MRMKLLYCASKYESAQPSPLNILPFVNANSESLGFNLNITIFEPISNVTSESYQEVKDYQVY
jgi:hypothetical protein